MSKKPNFGVFNDDSDDGDSGDSDHIVRAGSDSDFFNLGKKKPTQTVM